MSYMTIGEFAERTRLSPKALRLYDQLGLVVPARVDDHSGYRLYTQEQVDSARLVGLLRRVDMPLAVIAEVLAATDPDAAQIVADHWADVKATIAERQQLIDHLQGRLTGAPQTMYAIETRTLPERKLLTINRHVHIGATDAFFGDAFARLRSAGTGLPGVAGVPFLIFYGEVSEDSDGPLELCRPVAAVTDPQAVDGASDVRLRVEPAHDEIYIRLTLAETGWPTMLPAVDALDAWITEHDRRAAGPLRQVLIGDRRTATPDTPTCDLTVPLC
jgi:DNA-binding transcriptional MerR regulator